MKSRDDERPFAMELDSSIPISLHKNHQLNQLSAVLNSITSSAGFSTKPWFEAALSCLFV